MNDLEKKNSFELDIVSSIDYQLAQYDSFDINTCQKFPLEKIENLGVAFKPMVQGIQNVFGKGGANGGLMWVDAKGGQLFKNANGKFIGNIKNAAGGVGGGVAELSPLALDPTMLFVSMAMSNITEKIDEISETQKEIFDYMKNKDSAELESDLQYLSEILNDYHLNWNLSDWKKTRQMKVVDINKRAHEQIGFYHKEIQDELKKKDLIHWQKDAEKKTSKLLQYFNNYQMAVYLYSLSSYEDLVLTDNRNSDYIDTVVARIESVSSEYRSVYTNAYDMLEEYAKKSGEQYILKGAGEAVKALGKGVDKVPLLNKLPVNEKLSNAGEKVLEYKKEQNSELMKKMLNKQKAAVRPFIDNMELMKHIYNDDIQIGFDQNHIYLS